MMAGAVTDFASEAMGNRLFGFHLKSKMPNDHSIGCAQWFSGNREAIKV
jgi:hypothetical protein